jgi:hypothetical protein
MRCKKTNILPKLLNEIGSFVVLVEPNTPLSFICNLAILKHQKNASEHRH